MGFVMSIGDEKRRMNERLNEWKQMSDKNAWVKRVWRGKETSQQVGEQERRREGEKARERE